MHSMEYQKLNMEKQSKDEGLVQRAKYSTSVDLA